MQPGDFHSFSECVAELVREGVFFAPRSPVWVARAPGRLDVMGGNVDYTGGMVLQMPIRHAVWAAVQSPPEPVIRISNPNAVQYGWANELTIPTSQLSRLEAIEDICSNIPGAQWGRYVLGAFHLLNRRFGYYAQEGARLALASDLPPNRGLASSAALEVAVLKAASAAAGQELAGIALAEAAQWVENVVARSACGIMDQAAVVLGRSGSLLPILCQPCQPFPAMHLPASVRVWGIDSLVPRSTSSAVYDTARAAVFMGYKMISRWNGIEPVLDQTAPIPRWTEPRWDGYLSKLAPSEFRARYERKLPDRMNGSDFIENFGTHADPFTTVQPEAEYPVRAAVRYAAEENHRIVMAKILFESLCPRNPDAGLSAIGELLYQCHLAYSECGLGAHACDDLVALARKHGLFGAKMTGGGGGGVVAVLGLASQQEAVEQMAAEYASAHACASQTYEGSSNGADCFGARPVSIPRAVEVA